MLMTLTAAAAVACFCFFFLCFSFNKFKIKFSLNCRQSRRRPGQNPIRRKCLPAPSHSAAAPAAGLPSAQLAKLHASAGISLSLSLPVSLSLSLCSELGQSKPKSSCLVHCSLVSVSHTACLFLSLLLRLFRSVTFKLCLMLFFSFFRVPTKNATERANYEKARKKSKLRHDEDLIPLR